MQNVKNLMTIGLAAFCLVLVGCSSGGGDDDDGMAVVTPLVARTPGGGSTPVTPDTPDEVTGACATPSQACVDQLAMDLDEATAAHDALKDDDDATQGAVKAAEMAVEVATKAHMEAVTAFAMHMAMQPPTYTTAALAMAVAIATSGAVNARPAPALVPALDKGVVTTDNYVKVTWPAKELPAAGWKGSVYEESMTVGTKNSVVVYTNVEEAKAVKFSEYYAADDAPPGHATHPTVVNTATISTGNVVLDLNPTVDEASRALIDFAHGLTARNQRLMVMDGEFEGTFHGIEGTYACEGACTIESDDMGMLSMLTGEWEFTATMMAAEAMVAAVDTDDDYLDFGYWVETTTVDGAETYAVRALDPSGLLPSDAVTGVQGSATYTGGAAGLYSRSESDGSGVPTVRGSGRFTAEVELNANFGGNAISMDDANSISGRIFNFSARDAAEAVAISAWGVNLPKVKSGGTPSTGTFAAEFMSAPGDTSWTGQFYGDPGENNAQPTGVAGTFQQVRDDRTIVGAYGATR